MSNMDAISSPTPAAIRKTNPILPARVLTCDQIAKAKAQELTAHMANISDNAQPWCPFAYSLTIRHEGANSGLSKCRQASDSSAAADAAIAKRAPISAIVVSGSVIFLSVMLFRSLVRDSFPLGNFLRAKFREALDQFHGDGLGMRKADRALVDFVWCKVALKRLYQAIGGGIE